jgi:hypothetical protein
MNPRTIVCAVDGPSRAPAAVWVAASLAANVYGPTSTATAVARSRTRKDPGSGDTDICRNEPCVTDKGARCRIR